MIAAHPDAVVAFPGLLIVSAPRRSQREALVRLGVDVIVDLRAHDSAGHCWPTNLDAASVPIFDQGALEPELLRHLATWIRDRFGGGQRVLVYWHDGVAHPATVACAGLVGMGWPLSDAYQKVRACYRRIAQNDVELDRPTGYACGVSAGRG